MLGIVVNFISALTRLIQPISWSSYTLYFSHSQRHAGFGDEQILRFAKCICACPPFALAVLFSSTSRQFSVDILLLTMTILTVVDSLWGGFTVRSGPPLEQFPAIIKKMALL